MKISIQILTGPTTFLFQKLDLLLLALVKLRKSTLLTRNNKKKQKDSSQIRKPNKLLFYYLSVAQN